MASGVNAWTQAMFDMTGIRARHPRNACSACPESLLTLPRNPCSASTGIRARDGPEYAHLDATYWYLHATPHLLLDVASRAEAHARDGVR